MMPLLKFQQPGFALDMTNDIAQKLEKMGLHPGWFEYGFVDQAFVENAFLTFTSKNSEHYKIPFYSKFFSDREDTGLLDEDIERYLSLVNYETDPSLKSWAIGFLVETSCLTPSQLMRLSEHSLINQSEKHLFFLNQNLAEKMNNEAN